MDGTEATGAFLCRQMQGGGHLPDRGAPILFVQPSKCRVQECDARHGRCVGGGGTLLPHLLQAPGRVMGRRASYGMWVLAPLGLWDWPVVSDDGD